MGAYMCTRIYVWWLCLLPQADKTLAVNPQTLFLHTPSAPGKMDIFDFSV